MPSPLEVVRSAELDRLGTRLILKRDDRIHPQLSGNKWRKLQPNLEAALAGGHDTLLTFGGAYSNHLRAVAAAGHLVGLQTVGAVRGEEHQPLNPTLTFAVARGMHLVYLDRQTYRDKGSPKVLDQLHREFGDFYLVPEGGTNALAVRNCAEITREIEEPFDLICTPCGTGGTLAGMAAGLPPGSRALGFSALKGGDFLRDEVRRLQEVAFGTAFENWDIETGFHFGGFGRRTPELMEFVDQFEDHHGTPFEWVYVAKMLYGVIDLCRRGVVAPRSTVIAVITGPDEGVQSHNASWCC
ncbi:pyridoxal-phosphate dependent enzyme [Microlunatus parietis]